MLVNAVLGVLHDAGVLIVLVALRHPDGLGMTGKRAGRDAALGDLVALVTLGKDVEGGVGEECAAIQRYVW
jgi:hypothetical protein